MKKNKSKPILLAALTGLFLLMPVNYAYNSPRTAEAAQVSASHDSRLSAFDIAPGVLSPAFSPDITEYTSSVEGDVTSVSVQAVPRAAASGAVIASVEGRDGLRPGVNTIKVTCSAQDNTFTVYTITLTVGSASAGVQQPEDNPSDSTMSGGETQADGTGDPASSDNPSDSQPETGGDASGGAAEGDPAQTDGGETKQDAGTKENTQPAKSGKKRSLPERLSGAVKADGTVKLSGAAYQLSSNFTYGATTQDIPSAFGQGSVQIAGSSYPTLYCQKNGVHLVYMENTDGKGSTGFYLYDEMKQVVERFKYAGTGENFVIFINNAREEVPAGFQEKALKLPSGKKAAAYQNQMAEELKDYYLVYGIYADGTSGWYLYDKRQDTYMRYSGAFAAAQGQDDEQEEEVERTVSLTKYNTLNEKYTELKESRVKIVSILVIAMILVIIIFTALLLHSQGSDDDDDEEEGGVRSNKKKKTKRAGKQTEAISKSSLAAGRNFEGNVSKRSKKVTKTFTQEPAQEVPKRPPVRQDHISTPEEIRAQVSRGESGGYASPRREQMMRSQSESSTDTVQMAAERMRQSVRYPRVDRQAGPETAEPVHDPMDDWDMEETAVRKAQKAGRSSRKKRSRLDDDMEIMDLNDL